MSALEKTLWCVAMLLQAAVLFRLWRLALARVYPAFLFNLGIDLLQSALMFSLDLRTNTYAIAWMITEPLIWVSRTAVVYEICRGVLKTYQGIWVLSRRFLAGGLGISLLVALATLGPEWRFSTDLYPILLAFTLTGRTVLLVLTIFLTMLFVFLAWYPIALRPNLIRYAAGFALLFLIQAAALWIRNVHGGAQIQLVNRLLVVLPAAVYLFWLITLRARGEQIAVAVRQRAASLEKERLLAQLDQLNRALAGNRTPG